MLWENRKRIGEWLFYVAAALFVIWGIFEDVVPAIVKDWNYWRG